MSEFTHIKQPVLAAAGGMIELDVLYSSQDLAAILGVSTRSVERWRKDGRGPRVTRLYTNAPPKYRGKCIAATRLEAWKQAKRSLFRSYYLQGCRRMPRRSLS